MTPHRAQRPGHDQPQGNKHRRHDEQARHARKFGDCTTDSAAGKAWRTRVVYSTNMSTSYAAGRWQQLNAPEFADRPYWRYVHSDLPANPRPQHQAWHGLVLHRTPSLRPFPDLTQPETAFPQYPLGSLDPNLVVRQAPGAPCTSGPGAACAHHLAAQGTLERGTCLECRRATERASSGFFPRGASCALPSNLARTRRFNHPSCRQVTHPHAHTHDSSRF